MASKREKEQLQYNNIYGHIPTDDYERLSWLCDIMNLSENKMNEIIAYRDQMINSLYYNDLNIKLYEEPEGAKRPRFRLINRKNFANMAISNSNFVHVYTPNASSDNKFMKKLTEQELIYLDSINNGLICTPCIVEYITFQKIPKNWSQRDTILAEIGLIRPIIKPDWDNIGKKYSDMYNENIWLDDSFVIEGTVKKYYSILPRVEINLRYLNQIYNNNQYRNIINRKDFNEHDCSLNLFEYKEGNINEK